MFEVTEMYYEFVYSNDKAIGSYVKIVVWRAVLVLSLQTE